jgi:hypothetical protein
MVGNLHHGFRLRSGVPALDRGRFLIAPASCSRAMFSILHIDTSMSRYLDIHKTEMDEYFDAQVSSRYVLTVTRIKKTSSMTIAGKDDRKKTTISLPTSQYRALKIYAVQNDKEMSEVVSEALHKLGIG